MKSGNHNFLEPSGPLQACNGIALPLPCLFNLTENGKSPDGFTFCDTDQTSVTIYLRLSNRRHIRLRRYPIVSARRQHIVVLSPSVPEVPFETECSRIASVSFRFVSYVASSLREPKPFRIESLQVFPEFNFLSFSSCLQFWFVIVFPTVA